MRGLKPWIESETCLTTTDWLQPQENVRSHARSAISKAWMRLGFAA